MKDRNTIVQGNELGGYVLPRWQAQSARDALDTMRVVILAGARQVGKTTLAKTFAVEGAEFRDLDNYRVRASVSEDPDKFVEHDRSLMVVDEVQKVPDLMSAIKHAADRDQRPGRFLLTGSPRLWRSPASENRWREGRRPSA